IAHLKAIISEDLLDLSLKILGFKNEAEYFRKFNSLKDLAEKTDYLLKLVATAFIVHVYALGKKDSVELSKVLILQTIEQYWMEHLDTMSDLRAGIDLTSMAQRNPLVEYKNEGARLFSKMLGSIDEGIVNRFFKVRIVRQTP